MEPVKNVQLITLHFLMKNGNLKLVVMKKILVKIVKFN